ncbi:MAG TPA: murein biosynthesis integral membrane protein MurJ, partial [Desulfomonilaceae bacterium]|nr:murein biosynthesis integral membrane protein MurJ [Desulfomonilaceae bacterium]
MTRAAGVVGSWTVLSRILGFARDMVTALFLGAGFGADAFFVAFRIPNLLRRLFAEGALSAAFIPTFVETLHKDGRDRAARLARIAFTFTAIILGCVTVCGILFSSGLVHLIAPGFLQDPAKFSLTVDLNRIMFPYIFFISLVALASGVLNSMGHFSAPAAAPSILNLCMIGSVVLYSVVGRGQPVYALAWGVVVAGVLQLVLQLPFLAAQGIRLRPDFNFKHPALKKIGILFVPAAFGGAVYQINVMVGTILASMLPAGVSWLYYADRLVELPLG